MLTGMTTDIHDQWVVDVASTATRQDAHRTVQPEDENGFICWLTRAGLPAPPGFVVTADAYLRALDPVGGRGRLSFRIAGVDVDDRSAFTRAAKECQTLVRSAGMPDAVRRAVLDAYARLGRDVPVAVRALATAEDTASTSLAGMSETFTNVRGGLELVDRIVDCWASWWSPRVLAYRATRGLTVEPAMAVVVQRMVDAHM
jgi:pyruvate,water dikinase